MVTFINLQLHICGGYGHQTYVIKMLRNEELRKNFVHSKCWEVLVCGDGVEIKLYW